MYRVAATPMSPELWRAAALLWAGETSALSHRSAGAVWRLDGVTETKPELSKQRTKYASHLVSVHRCSVPPGEVVTRNSFSRHRRRAHVVLPSDGARRRIARGGGRMRSSPLRNQSRSAQRATRNDEPATEGPHTSPRQPRCAQADRIRARGQSGAASVQSTSAQAGASVHDHECSDGGTASTSRGRRYALRSNATGAPSTNSSVIERGGVRSARRAGVSFRSRGTT